MPTRNSEINIIEEPKLGVLGRRAAQVIDFFIA